MRCWARTFARLRRDDRAGARSDPSSGQTELISGGELHALLGGDLPAPGPDPAKPRAESHEGGQGCSPSAWLGRRAKNAVSRAKALRDATTAEQQAAQRGPNLLRELALTLHPGVEHAIAKLAADHNITATVGWSTGSLHFAGGIPLVGQDGVPVAVFDPNPTRVCGDAFRLLAGMLLLFPDEKARHIFENASNTKKKHRPIDGYRTEVAPAPVCECTTPQLVARISNAEYPAEPSETMGPAVALFAAYCRTCGRPYEGTWRRIS